MVIKFSLKYSSALKFLRKQIFSFNCQKLWVTFVSFVGDSFTSFTLTWDRSAYGIMTLIAFLLAEVNCNKEGPYVDMLPENSRS